MKKITDTAILEQLNAHSGKVTDAEILRQLNGEVEAPPAPPAELSQAEVLAKMKSNPGAWLDGLLKNGLIPLKEGEAEFDPSTALKNAPASAWQLAKNIAQPFMHPIDTATGISNLAQGAYEKLTPGIQEHEKYADAVGDFYSKRYGSRDAFRRTAMEDPVGALADVSGGIFAGSLPLRAIPQTANAAKSAQRVGMAIDPVNATLNAAKAGIGKVIPKGKPGAMYESAAKFSTTIPKKKRDVMVQTALDEGLTPTGRGVAALENLIDSIDGKIESLIKTATENGGKVPVRAVFADLKELRQKLGAATSVDGIGDLAKVSDTAKKISLNQGRLQQTHYTVAELQQLKRNLYKSANFDIKQAKADPAVNQARKAIAKEAKSMIEEKLPEVGALNKRYGKLIDLQDSLTRSANRIDNRNLISINQPLNTGVGYGVGGVEGGLLASALTALGNPKVKPHVAIWANKLQKQGLLGNMLDNAMIPYVARQGLLQSSRVNDSHTK